MSKVTLKHVYKVYEGGVRAVNDFDLEIKDKEFIVFVGPSGCGKSTTLRMIAGLENITAGQLYIDEVLVNDMDSKDRDIAMVFQNYALYPHMTVYQNMAFGLKLRKEDPKAIDERVKKAADILEISDLLSRKPKALSGGQRQRVALGRAIVREPKVFLLDEPLSNLDAKLRVQMRTEITKLHKRLATTFIYVTHDQTEAMTMGDRIVVMKLGFVQQVDTPVNLYENPTNLFVATFLGSPQMNIIDCHLKEEGGKLVAILNNVENLRLEFPALKAKQLSDRSYLDKDLLLGIRPEHIKIAEAGLPAVIDVIEQLGDETIVYAKIEGRSADVVIKGVATGKYQAKQSIFLAPDMMNAHLFDKESTNSIMGVPRENRFLMEIEGNQIHFGENRFTMEPSFQQRILQKALQEKPLYLSFAPKDVKLENPGKSLILSEKVDFLMEKTDATTLFVTLPGCSKHLVFNVPSASSYKEGDEVVAYVAESALMIRNSIGDKVMSREIVYDNVVQANVKTLGDESVVSFGHTHLRVAALGVADGVHQLRIDESKVVPIFSKKQCKSLERKNPEFDPKKTLKVSAYDEDPLGSMNTLFVKIEGFKDYATFVVPNDFSVYKAPKFRLLLQEGALSVLS
jgi:multiple sugar transport system ATP-binding protein